MPIRRYLYERLPDMSDAVVEATFAKCDGTLRYTADRIGFSFLVASRIDSDPAELPRWVPLDILTSMDDDADLWEPLKLTSEALAKDAIHKAADIATADLAVGAEVAEAAEAAEAVAPPKK